MGFGLYIHVPFCIVKCRYCAFYSLPAPKSGQVFGYLAALKEEINFYGSSIWGRSPVDTVYFGGGTPTCLSISQLIEVLNCCRAVFLAGSCQEISIEVNPGMVKRQELRLLRQAGFNRLSIGLQSVFNEHLNILGRIHKIEDVFKTFRAARGAGFDNINLDLIYGIPGQTLEQWAKNLKTAISLNPEHLSCYGLQLEPGTPLTQAVATGELLPVEEEMQLAMFRLTHNLLTEAGYEHYEIANYALKGRRCLHNLGYWENRDYLGLGPSAHSHLAGKRWWNKADLAAYSEWQNGGHPPLKTEWLEPRAEMGEMVFLALRLADGLEKRKFHERFGKDIEEVFGETIQKLADLGLLNISLERLMLTNKGLEIADYVFAEFV